MPPGCANWAGSRGGRNRAARGLPALDAPSRLHPRTAADPGTLLRHGAGRSAAGARGAGYRLRPQSPGHPLDGAGPGAAYRCYDIDAGLVGFLNEAFPLLGVAGSAHVRNLVSDPPAEPVDLALAFKALPTLESLNRAAPARLLRTLRARHMLVSFPARTLGGRNKGMAESYAARFEALAATEGYAVQPFAFPTEIAFLAVRE